MNTVCVKVTDSLSLLIGYHYKTATQCYGWLFQLEIHRSHYDRHCHQQNCNYWSGLWPLNKFSQLSINLSGFQVYSLKTCNFTKKNISSSLRHLRHIDPSNIWAIRYQKRPISLECSAAYVKFAKIFLKQIFENLFHTFFVLAHRLRVPNFVRIG